MRGAKSVAVVLSAGTSHRHRYVSATSPVTIALCYLGLLLFVLSVYGQLGRGVSSLWPGAPFEFIALDDPDYISENDQVRRGLSASGLHWAFGQAHVGNWHPLTWLSLMLDCQVHGPTPAGPHLTNALLHLANALLLFTLLWRMTAQIGPSFLVAAVWGIHPLHAESVAWISERKDVLSTFFALLAILAYVRYARQPSVWRYLLVLFAFVLSLLSKQMWVTLPCVLLMLDYWPLGRVAGASQPETAVAASQRAVRQLIWEKVPLFALSIAFSLMIYIVQRDAGAMSDVGAIPFAQRLPNVAVSYWMYLFKTFWPTQLAIMYPFAPEEQRWFQAIACSLPILAITVVAVTRRKSWPWLLVGWLWFLGMLVPVIGLVAIGSHAWADRYSYGPQIGLLFAVVWSAAALLDWLEQYLARRTVRAGAAVLAVCCLVALTIQGHHQVSIWRGTEPLFAHTIAVTGKNDRFELTLAGYLVAKQQYAEAEQRYQALLRRAPENLAAKLDLGALWIQQGRIGEAEELFAETIRLYPENAAAHARLAGVMLLQSRADDAIAAYETAIKLRPDWAPPRNDLAWILATDKSADIRSAARAVTLAEEACQLTNHQDPALLDTLAAAYAESGRWDDSIRVADQAIQLARARGSDAIAADIESRADLYRRRQPYRAP